MIIHLFNSAPYVDLPYQLLGWIGWFSMAAVIMWILRRNWLYDKSKSFWVKFLILTFFTVLTSLFFGVELPITRTLPLPNITRENAAPVVMIFAAVPWIIASGFLGVWPAALLGFLGGLINSLWNTHTIFTPLETSALALLLALAMRQDYRTKIFRFLRRPIGAALVVSVLASPVFLISTFFATNGSIAAKLDYAFTQTWIPISAYALQIILAGLICEIFLIYKSKHWVQIKTFVPSPIETGLQNRILFVTLPIVLILLLSLAIADWVVAGRSARQMIESQLQNSASIAVENIPAILETGHSLALSLVDSQLPLNDKGKIQQALKAKIRQIPYFTQLFMFDLTGKPMTGYPTDNINDFKLTAVEETAIQLALNGVLIQNYFVAPQTGKESTQITFIASIPDEYGLSKGVVIARTDFSLNLFSQPAILALRNIKDAGGQGAILDSTSRIVYHTNSSLLLQTYPGIIPDASGLYEDSGADGTRQLVYAAVDEHQGWRVILSLPASYTQELALRIAIPLLAISIGFSLAAYLLLRFLINKLTGSLVQLAGKAEEISKGSLDDQIDIKGVDEIGQLGSAFEQMRVSLKSRLEELDTLLKVTQGIASSLNIESAAKFLLEAGLSYGADTANLVLLRGSSYGWDDELVVFRDGKDAEIYSPYDKPLLEMLKTEKILVIPSKARIKRMGIAKGTAQPAALAGISVMDGDALAGILWIAYSQPHRFMDAEIRFLNTLTGQATLAVTNANLYMKAEVGKRRLESVLASTPEPVLVAGEAGNLLIANNAAKELVGLVNTESTEYSDGEIASEILKGYLLNVTTTGSTSDELTLENGRSYLVSVSNVNVENTHVGKVCVLRDVTEYKELEKIKSEFVSTVSHDVKGPLSLIRGYASMLQMVGELNPQQKEYSGRIMEGIESITKMTDNLLDLGRIDSGVELKYEKIAPFELLEEVIVLLQPLANQRKVQFMRELTIAQELTIEADKALLQQAVYNLLENAIKFSPINGQVNLRMQVNEQSVIFEIQDHGPGIAPLDLPNIFNWFGKTGQKDTTPFRGSGLGLSIVKSIADRHKGRVWVDSVLGKGCTFFLEIPTRQTSKQIKKKA